MAEDKRHEDLKQASVAKPLGGDGGEPSQSSAPVAFSMSHALSIIRRRQEEQRRAKDQEEKRLEEERKEKAREKRRRRRRNQKDRKVKLRAEVDDEMGEDHSSKEANSNPDLDVEFAVDEGNSRPDNLKRSANEEEDSDSAPESSNEASLPVKKRLKLKHDTPADQGVADATAQRDAIRLRSFIPRALLVKKKKIDEK